MAEEPRTVTDSSRKVLREFVDDVLQLLQLDETQPGRFLVNHIRRQTELASSPRYHEWFRLHGEKLGFVEELTLAAVAGSDVTKISMISPTARRHFGTTAERVAALAAAGDLRYGRVFASYSPLENLYMHSEAGRHFTFEEIVRRGSTSFGRDAASSLARAASDSIIGHDSFNAGFGRYRLKQLLAEKHRLSIRAFDYPVSCTPTGFIVQALDRLEGCDAETMVRYVLESNTDFDKPLAESVISRLWHNYFYLKDVQESLLRESAEKLTSPQHACFRDSPVMADLGAALDRIPRLLSLIERPDSGDGASAFYLRTGAGRRKIESLDAFRVHFVAVASTLT